jgi:hypothetical protein
MGSTLRRVNTGQKKPRTMPGLLIDCGAGLAVTLGPDVSADGINKEIAEPVADCVTMPPPFRESITG